MAFSSILSSSHPEPEAPSPSTKLPPTVKEPRKSSRTFINHSLPAEENRPKAGSRASPRQLANEVNKSAKARSRAEGATGGQTRSRTAKNRLTASDRPPVSLKASSITADEAAPDDMDTLDLGKEKLKFKERSKKRLAEVEQTERRKQKVRCARGL